jgi:homoserine kinase
MSDFIRIFAPATVSNVGPGFDLMGFALSEPGDVLSVKKNKLNQLRIINQTGISLPEENTKNVSTVAVSSLLNQLNIKQGFDLIFEKKINPGSGIGSSAASCTAAVYGVSRLLKSKLVETELIYHALQGEFVASGSIHADNIAPAMLGGFVLIRSYDPIDIIRLKVPEKLLCTIVHPDIEIKTSESRKLIPTSVSTKDSISQSGNAAALIAGIATENYELIGRSLEDKIAEPVRKNLIPGYTELKQKLKSSGILGMNISGSGPSIFALSDSSKAAENAEKIMNDTFNIAGIACKTYISKVSEKGTRIIE